MRDAKEKGRFMPRVYALAVTSPFIKIRKRQIFRLKNGENPIKSTLKSITRTIGRNSLTGRKST